jgi:hypothetical protein
MSVLGACWAQAHFGEKAIFGEKSTKWKKRQLEGKATCVREACKAHMQGRPNYIRVRVFARYCNG